MLRVSPVAFALVFAIELLLLVPARSTRARTRTAARIAMCVVPLVLALACRAYQALATPGILEWDETYYLSTAVTGAAGRGLYPYVFGYGPMPILGGLGYAAYLYVIAVKIAGPTILALRVVSLLASIAALLFVWLLLRRLYGSAAAWMGVALTSALRIFSISNTARMDSVTFAWVTAGLLVVAIALERVQLKRWHFLAGLVFGLGLQAHVDTAISAAGCGLLYLVRWVIEMRRARSWTPPASMLLYVAGWCAGLGMFVLFNVLPDPHAFYSTTVRIRVDATGWYSPGTSSLLGSFIDPRILLAKSAQLYGVLFRQLHVIEVAAVLLAAAVMLARRTAADLNVAIVMAGVVVATAILLNNASPLYFIHAAPALLIPIGPLFSHGWRRRERVGIADLSPAALLVFAAVVSALFAVNSAKTAANVQRTAPDAAEAAFVARVRATLQPSCVIAGDGSLYVTHFADYPYFVSGRPTEVSYARLYHEAADEDSYWELKAPGAVFWRGPLPEGLSSYVRRHRIPEVGEGIWATRACLANQGR